MTKLRTLLRALALCGLVCLPQTAASAQNRELEAAAKKYYELKNRAEELLEAGKVNDAERVLAQAKELAQRLEMARRRIREREGNREREHGEREKGEHRDGNRERTRERGADDYHGLFHHLEAAVGALQELGMAEHAEKLAGHARELRAKLARRERGRDGRPEGRERDESRQGSSDREQLERELAIFRFAKGAFAETNKRDMLDLTERAMHARELKIAGRGDREARQIIHAAPSAGNEVELLSHAARILREFRAGEKATAVAQLAERLAARNKAKGKKQPTEREVGEQQLEYLMYSANVLQKAQRLDAADSMRRAANALKLRLQGRRGEEAQQVYRKAPGRDAIARHLGLTAEILQDQGDREHAAAVAKVARQFAGRGERERRGAREERRERDRDSDRRTDSEQRIAELQERVSQLERAMQQMRKTVERLSRRRDP